MKKKLSLFSIISFIFASFIVVPSLTSCNSMNNIVDLTVNVEGNGTVTPSINSGKVGENVTLTVNPAQHYELASLTFNGTDIKETLSFSLVKGENVVDALFTKMTDPLTRYEEAVAADYSNATVTVYQTYNGGNEEVDISYLMGNYDIVYSPAMAEAAGYEYAFIHYYVEQVESDSTNILDHYNSYTYWESEGENSKGGWIQKGYKNSDLSVWNAYFYLPLFLDSLDVNLLSYFDGIYYFNDELYDNAFTDYLNTTVFGFAYFVDVNFVYFTISSDTGLIESIFAVEDDGSGDVKNFVQIKISAVGSTTDPIGVSKYDIPNDENKTTYWEYKGWPHDYEVTYIEEIHLTVAPNQDVTGDDSFDVILPLDGHVVLAYDTVPNELEPWELIYDKNNVITWHYAEDKLEKDFGSASKTVDFHAISSGEVEIYATMLGENDVTIESEHITVKIEEAPTIDTADAVYDFQIIGINESDDVRSVQAINKAVDSKALYSITTGPKAKLINSSNSDIYEAGQSIFVVSPAEQGNYGEKVGLFFNFGEQQVSTFTFEYGLFYSNHFSNISNLSSVVINTYNDDTLVSTIDVTNVIKNTLSEDFAKIYSVDFDPSNRIEITFSASTIGKNISIALSRLVFHANEACRDYIAPEDIIPVSTITLSASDTTLFVGDTTSLFALVEPNNATYKDVTYSIQSGDDVISITEDGTVTAIKEGSAVVIATDKKTNTVTSNELTITVSNIPTVSSAADGEYVEENGTYTLTVNGNSITFVEHHYDGDVTVNLTYSNFVETSDGIKFVYNNQNNETITVLYSSNYKSLTVSNVLLLKDGELKAPSKSSFNFTKNIYPTSFKVTSVTGSVTKVDNTHYNTIEGKTAYISTNTGIVFTPSDTNVKDVTFKSTNNEILTVSYDEEYGNATINFVKAGTASVVVSLKKDASINYSIEFTVASLIYPTEDDIVITTADNKTEITQGEKLQLTATLTNDSEITSDKTVTWSVENGADVTYTGGKIASISKTGELSTITKEGAVGTVIVTASFKGANNTTVSKSITITIVAPSGSEVISAASGLLGTWTGIDDNNCTVSITITNDGKLVLDLNDSNVYGIEFQYTSDDSWGYYFDIVDESEYGHVSICVYLSSSDTVQFSFVDGGSLHDYSTITIYGQYIDLTK